MTSPATQTFKRPQQLRLQHFNETLPLARVLYFLNSYPSCNRWFVSIRTIMHECFTVARFHTCAQSAWSIPARHLHRSFLHATTIGLSCAQHVWQFLRVARIVHSYASPPTIFTIQYNTIQYSFNEKESS